MQDDTPPPDYTPASAGSLRELRAEMLRRAAETAAKARACRARGDLVSAQALEQRAAHLHEVARKVHVT